MLGMTAWHIWTDQARAVNRRGLRTQKTRLQRLCREVFAQTMGAEFWILIKPSVQLMAATKLRVLKPQSKLRDHVAFAEKGFCRERRYRAGRRQSRKQTVPTCRLGPPSFVHATHTLMTHCLQSKGRRRRQTTPRRNESLARAETGSSAKTKTTARTSERKARPVWVLGRKEKCLRWLLIHGTTRAQLHAK